MKVKKHERQMKTGKIVTIREHQRNEAIKLFRKTQPIVDDVRSTPKMKKLAKDSRNFARQFL